MNCGVGQRGFEILTCIFKKALLKYSWCTMLWSFLLYNKAIQLYTCTHPFFFRFFSHIDDHRTLGRVPCAQQQVPMAIRSVDDSVHGPIVNWKTSKLHQCLYLFCNTTKMFKILTKLPSLLIASPTASHLSTHISHTGFLPDPWTRHTHSHLKAFYCLVPLLKSPSHPPPSSPVSVDASKVFGGFSLT